MDLLRCMQAFVMSVKTGSFVATSISLNTSAQMVAKYIAYLENHLGLKLLNRTTRSQSLTEFGQQYYHRCELILAEVKASNALAQQYIEEPTGTLRMSAPVSYAYSNLLPLLSRFMQLYPQVNVDLQLNDRYVDLTKENYDIVFRIGAINDSGLIARKLKPYQMIFAAAPSYLTKYGIPSTPDELKSHQCLIYQYANRNNKDYLWPFTCNGQVIRQPIAGSFRSNNVSALASAAIEGLGITMLPEIMLAQAISQNQLIPILQDFLPPAKEMHLLYSADPHRLPKLTMFIEFIIDALL